MEITLGVSRWKELNLGKSMEGWRGFQITDFTPNHCNSDAEVKQLFLLPPKSSLLTQSLSWPDDNTLEDQTQLMQILLSDLLVNIHSKKMPCLLSLNFTRIHLIGGAWLVTRVLAAREFGFVCSFSATE